jgi:RimJ/RimL family protein N-acetyltransferase
MPDELEFETIAARHLPELAAALCHDDVYRFIGGRAPPFARVLLGLQRAIAGPPAGRERERWHNYLVRLRGTGEIIGRVQATELCGNAEVAFLLTPRCWGRGYARQGLLWLQGRLLAQAPQTRFFATTLPDNSRSRALLRRCGYIEIEPALAPHLLSYAPGDLVYVLQAPVDPQGASPGGTSRDTQSTS